MRTVFFTAIAQAELDDGRVFYEFAQPGLGEHFTNEVRDAVARIIEYPYAWSIERGEIRKCLLHRFPYKILYAIEKEHIVVLAIAHQHRKPDYWINAR